MGPPYIWGPTTASSIDRIQQSQLKAANMIHGKYRNGMKIAHRQYVLDALNWLINVN